MIQLLKQKNFFFMFSGRVLTKIGDSIYSVAAMWLIYELTGNSFYTGIAGALIMLPGAFEFLLGPLVDRWKLKSILVYTQWSQGILILLIPISYFLGFLNVGLIIIVMFLATCIEQIVYPAQQAAIPKLLKKEELVKGNSLMTLAYQGIDIVLIGLSGLLIVYIGAINIYIIDVITFLIAGAIFSLIKMAEKEKIIPQPISIKETKQKYFQELKEGKDFVIKSIILKMIIPISLINFVFGMITAIMPEFSNKMGGGSYYGYFLATMSIGTLLGAFGANFSKKSPIGYTTIIGFIIASISWGISYFTSIPILSLLFFGAAFIPISIHNVVLVSTLQSLVPEELIGRVFAWFGSITAIFLPIGSFLGGYLSTQMDVGKIYGLGSIGLLFIAIYWLIYSQLRKMPPSEKIKPEDYRLTLNKNKKAHSSSKSSI